VRTVVRPRIQTHDMAPAAMKNLDSGAAGRRDASGTPSTAADTPGEGSATRRRILQIALSLMAQRGVDGTSMRDLASAAGLNVASLYHYFPSKRDLLEAVLVEQGFLPVRVVHPVPDTEELGGSPLAGLLADIMLSLFQVDDFVRLMTGEAMRGDETARAVGLDLFSTFQVSIEEWISKNRPDLAERSGAPEMARFLCAMVVGLFVEHAAGVISEEADDLTALAVQRAKEAASILRPPD
jgi:AcrR family transcriptional regulator